MDRFPTKTEFPATPSALVSPWVTYLTGKKVSANSFLKQMRDGVVDIVDETTGKSEKKKTGRINAPDKAARTQFVEALVADPSRMERMLLMLRASVSANDAIRGIVMDLTGTVIVHTGVLSSLEHLDDKTFGKAVSSWLASITDRPLKPATMDILLLLLLFGWHRQLLDHDMVLDLVASAAVITKTSEMRTDVGRPVSRLLDALLVARVSEAVLQPMLTYIDESKAEKDGLQISIRAQTDQIAHLTERIADLEVIVSDLRERNAEAQEQKLALESMIVQLRAQGEDIRASFQHKLDDVRGHLRGTLQGKLTRWLETCVDANRARPPKIEVIDERLEEALKVIEKELQWLQPSA